MSCPRLVIAATGSGVGKTSVTLALVRALARRGCRVQTFKVGPDYLDPTHLALASGRPCYNLDSWMCGSDYVRELFARKTADADVAVIEGVMGLFDGASADTLEGSTAEIARLLDAPVVLVVGVHGVARSLAATVKGFATFEPELRLAAVIANHCGSGRHADVLRDALSASGLPPLLGALPGDAFPTLESRHLGLHPAASDRLSVATLDAFADAFERNADVDVLTKLAEAVPPTWHLPPSTFHLPPSTSHLPPSTSHLPPSTSHLPPSTSHLPPSTSHLPPSTSHLTPSCLVTIAIARDDAFFFYYPDNLEALEERGAVLKPFSPLRDRSLPERADALYLGGGYPEAYAAELAANTPMLDSMRAFAAGGGAVFAECGGLMLLSQAIETLDGTVHAMAGLLPVRTRMCPRRKVLGYVEATLAGDCLFGSSGDNLRGHEFHYSEAVPPAADGQEGWEPAYLCRYRRAPDPVPVGWRRGRILAGYPHLHFASRPAAADRFVKQIGGRK